MPLVVDTATDFSSPAWSAVAAITGIVLPAARPVTTTSPADQARVARHSWPRCGSGRSMAGAGQFIVLSRRISGSVVVASPLIYAMAFALLGSMPQLVALSEECLRCRLLGFSGALADAACWAASLLR